MQDWFFSLEGSINMAGKNKVTKSCGNVYRDLNVTPPGIQALNALAAKAQDEHFRRHNMLYLESAICCMLQQDDAFTVAAILVRQADQLIADI